MDIVKQSFSWRLSSGDNFTISGNLNRVVVIGAYGIEADPSAVKFNSQDCTKITSGAIGTSYFNSVWIYLPGSLAAGAYAITGTNLSRANVWEFYNVNQGAPILDSNYVENETAGTTALTSNAMATKPGAYLVSHVVMDTAQSAPYITTADGSTVDGEGDGYRYAAISRAITSGLTGTIGVSAFANSTKRCLASISLNPKKPSVAGVTFFDGIGIL